DGELDPRIRGRWAARNAVFCDLMVRTGLRLGGQGALVLSELPLQSRGSGGYQRFWLPEAIAKGGSARTVYTPDSVIADLVAYVVCDRADVIAQARAMGRYARVRRPLILDEGGMTATQTLKLGSARRVKVAHLGAEQRERLFVAADGGLEPAALWLGEHGMPLSPARWKAMFTEANARCARAGIDLAAHAHMLRHSFAVITLEQLQRGHLAALAELSQDQRGHYVRVFGDPLDWVRRLLGHRSVVTTQIYLDTLAELEMQTRMALVPDEWPDPRTGAIDEQAMQVLL
ncbi:MAG: integrase, partial [Aeromicrobium sp.]|nr:integrase [Aeromicrobium sp.]